MALHVKHAFTSSKTDGGDATKVQPSNWNAEHTFTCAADVMLGRDSSGAGSVQELTVTAAGRALIDDANAAAQRTTLGLGALATANTVATATIDDASITTAKIVDANVTTAKIADANVTTVKILDANVTTVKILDANVTTAKLADGAVTLVKLDNASKAFGAQLLHVQDQKASGTDGGTFTAGSWVTRTLNTTLTNEISSASLAGNQITLPAGTYYIEATAVGFACEFNKVKLANITDTSDILIGLSYEADAGTNISLPAYVSGRFTLAGTKVLALQHRCSSTKVTFGLGRANSFSVVEVYADVKIWKVG